jgi:hypothetical protein
MDSLPVWDWSWITVVAIGLSPILTTFVVLIVGRRFPRAGFRRSAREPNPL